MSDQHPTESTPPNVRTVEGDIRMIRSYLGICVILLLAIATMLVLFANGAWQMSIKVTDGGF